MALLEIATAERTYSAGHGTYGTFEQLRAEGLRRLAPIAAATRSSWN